ncbi:MAG TPA: hypothetical protein VJR05_00515 [Acidimicrobiia bacterium]|nr:hypothetical protein [Acidimicrobiia bacterium]
MPGAIADCERILPGFFGQPVNTITCLGFLVGAATIWQRRGDRPTALLVAGVGLGSIAFHGPMFPGAELLHDVTIAWVLIWIVLWDLGRVSWWPGAFLIGAAASATPAVADPGQALLAGAVVISQLRRPTTQRLMVLAVAATGAIIGRLSATGGPLCRPDTIWQGHGWWHLSAAAALTGWALYLHPRLQTKQPAWSESTAPIRTRPKG